jgi:hypothetical protein
MLDLALNTRLHSAIYRTRLKTARLDVFCGVKSIVISSSLPIPRLYYEPYGVTNDSTVANTYRSIAVREYYVIYSLSSDSIGAIVSAVVVGAF